MQRRSMSGTCGARMSSMLDIMSCIVDIRDYHRHARWPALEIRRTVSAESGARSDRPAQGEGWLAGRLRTPGSSRCRHLSIAIRVWSRSFVGRACGFEVSTLHADERQLVRSALVPGYRDPQSRERRNRRGHQSGDGGVQLSSLAKPRLRRSEATLPDRESTGGKALAPGWE